MSDILFSAGYYFSQVYPFKLFPLEISLGAGYIFLSEGYLVRFLFAIVNTDIFCSYFYEKSPKTCTLPDFVLLATSYPLTMAANFRAVSVLSGAGQSETKLVR